MRRLIPPFSSLILQKIEGFREIFFNCYQLVKLIAKIPQSFCVTDIDHAEGVIAFPKFEGNFTVAPLEVLDVYFSWHS